MFRKVLVANRGEIAVRVIRALREMGIPSVVVYSDADRRSLAVRLAGEAVHIGPSPSAESYLRIERIIEAARSSGAEAIHPGYGFLSENAGFAAACEQAGIAFIGPPAESIGKLGSKTAARALARAAGAPVVPGADEPLDGLEAARRALREVGYPSLLKAVAGGGGRGMRRVDSEEALAAALRDAASEAEGSFGSGQIYIERLLNRPRHIEIQVLGDRHGNLIHLGERECSIQRRHQKVVEECPSPLVSLHPEMRPAMGEAALKVARAAGYHNAGTAEFLVDADRNFYFLEMNTRLQVEHPVTELVTGLDLVQWQIRIAAGERLAFRQEDVHWRGAAIECRLYAEDPENLFFPCPGVITQLGLPAGPGIRLDNGVYQGWNVPVEYDPLLAKLAVWAGTRQEAIERMLRALDETTIGGIKTNVTFFSRLLGDERFRRGELHTGFLDDFGWPVSMRQPRLELVAALAAAADGMKRRRFEAPPPESRWLAEGRSRALR